MYQQKVFKEQDYHYVIFIPWNMQEKQLIYIWEVESEVATKVTF